MPARYLHLIYDYITGTLYSRLLIWLANLKGYSGSKLLIESKVHSAESRSDAEPKVRTAQADANLDQGLYIYM